MNVPDVGGSGIYEHVHEALCGIFWWSNLAVDGVPNGYSVYEFSGKHIVDSYFIGVNDHMNTRDYQMRIYRGGVKYGGSYIYFKNPHPSDVLLINVFNSDANWKVEVYENGVLQSGNSDYMDHCYHMYKYTMKDPSASIKVVATDTFGNSYSCTEVVEQDCWYPDYIR